MADKKLLGGECKLYRNSGTYGSPTWNEITNVEDLSMPNSKGRGEFKVRGSKYVKKRGAKIEAALNWKQIYDPGDDDFTVLLGSMNSGTILDLACVDGAIATSGTQGLRADMEVMEFPLDEPLESGVSIAVVAEVAISANEPTWMTVA